MPKSPIDVALLTASADSFAAALDNFLLKEQAYIEYLRSRQRFFFVTAILEKFITVTPTVPEVESEEEPGGGISQRRRQRDRQRQPQEQLAPVPSTAPAPAPAPAPVPVPSPAPAPVPPPQAQPPVVPPVIPPRREEPQAPVYTVDLEQIGNTLGAAALGVAGFAFSLLFGREFAYAKGGTTPGTLVSYPEGGFIKKPVLTSIDPSGEPTIIIPAPKIGDIIKSSFDVVGSLMVGATSSLLEFLPPGEGTGSILLGMQSLRRKFGSAKFPKPIPGGVGNLMKVEKSQLGIASFIETLNIPLPFLQQTPPGQMVTVTGGTADFWALVAVASREDGEPQAWADVAQSIYNRLASGAYSGDTIKELIVADMQYEPTWQYPNGTAVGRGKANPEWHAIGDRATAAAAAGMSEGAMQSVANALMDPTLQENARQFIQGRTDFRAYSVSGGIQRKSGDNYYGWYNNYRENKIGSVPNFGTVAASPQQNNLGPTGAGYGQGGGWLEMLSRFLPNTGNVIAPRGTQFVGQGTVKQKLLGIDIGETKTTYTQQDIDRFNQKSRVRKLIPTTKLYEGPQGRYDAQATKTVSPEGDGPSTNQRLNTAIQNARDLVNTPGASQYKGLVESSADSSVKRQQYYDTLRETMRQTNTPGWDQTIDLRGNEQSRSLTPSKRPEENFTVAYAPVYIPGSVTYVPMSNSKENDFDYFDPFGRGVRNSTEGFAIT